MNVGVVQGVLQRTQLKFTFMIVAIAAVLLAVSFVIIYLFTMFSTQADINIKMSEALEAQTKNPDITSETIRDDYGCMVFVVEDTKGGKLNEDELPMDYEPVYEITRQYNVQLHFEGEYEMVTKSLIVATEENISPSFERKNDRLYLSLISSSNATNKFFKSTTDVPTEPVTPPKKYEPIRLGKNVLYEEDEESISITVQNKTYAIYDFTAEQSPLNSLIIILIIVFVGAVGVVFVFSFFLSGIILDPAKDAFLRQKELVANASHELKTPITIINANLEVLSANNETKVAENMKWLKNIEDQTSRMNDLVIEMLELSSFESTSYVPDIQSFNLSYELEGAMLSFEAASFEKHIKMTSRIEPNIKVISDKKGIVKLINILLDNAVKYCGLDGTIRVALSKKKKYAIFSIGNSGDEIPPEKLEKIFERFYKMSDNSASFGLGLSMAKTIVDNLGGKIVCSSKNGFNKFTVTLPL